MGDLSKNFSRSEFECKCNYPECTRTPVDGELIDVLQDLVDHFTSLARPRWMTFQRVACTPTSGYRCTKHDHDITDGKSSGIHQTGMAADVILEYVFADRPREQIPQEEVADYLEHRYPDQYGIGRYPRPDWKPGDRDRPRNHIDVRNDGPARWTA